MSNQYDDLIMEGVKPECILDATVLKTSILVKYIDAENIIGFMGGQRRALPLGIFHEDELKHSDLCKCRPIP